MHSHPDYLPKKVDGIIKMRSYARIFALLSIFFTAMAYGSTGDKEILSAAERAWLAKNQSRLVLAVETGYAPFVFLDSKDQPTGLAHDYMRLIEAKLGVHFKQRRFSSLSDIFEKVHSGEVQIVNAVTSTPDRKKFLFMTAPFISVPNVIVVSKDRSGQIPEYELSGLKVSLVKSYAVTEHMTNRGLHFVPDLVSDDLAALLNVSFGRSDAAVIDLATASYLISEKGIANLRVAGEVVYDIRLSIATPLDEPVLHGILQKGLDAITDAERQEIKNRWINASDNQSIFKDRQFWIVLGGVLAVALAIFTIILVWNRTLRRQVALRTEALAKERKHIAERTQMEMELRNSEARLTTAQHIAHIGNWELDFYNNRLWWSEEIFRIFEIDSSRFGASYDAFLAAIHPDDRETVNRAYLNSLENKAPYEIEHRLLFSDGRIKYVHERCESEFDQHGKALRSIGTVQDISERKQMELELRKFKAIVESTDDAIISKTLNGIIESWNPGAEKMFGYTAQEAIGRPIAMLIPRDRLNEEDDILSRISHGERIEHYETVRCRKDGQLLDISTTISPIIDNDGKVIGASKIARDITERKAIENKIHNLAFYDTLTQLANRRLLNDRLNKTMAASKRSGHYGALMFLDLDNFKPLNDTYGHGVGDLLLIEVANRLKSCVREADTVARFGGDEFVVMLSELGEDKEKSTTQASMVAEKIRTTLFEPYFLKIQHEGKAETIVEHHSAASIGVALFINHEASAEDIIKWADTAMYQAKKTGRNQFRFYEPKT